MAVKLIAEERQSQIAQMIMMNGSISVKDIMSTFSITSETARKDLIELEKRGMLQRRHGGAVMVNNYLYGSFFIQKRMEQNREKKQKIAQTAKNLICPNNTIILDSGSTTFAIAEALSALQDIRIISNGLPIVNLMAERKIPVMMIGGEVFCSDLSAVGDWVDLCLNNIHASIAFIGASGLGNSSGPSVENYSEAMAKRSILAHVEHKYVVADSTKISTHSFVQFGNWNEIDALIIDDGVTDEFVSMISSKVKCIIAK